MLVRALETNTRGEKSIDETACKCCWPQSHTCLFTIDLGVVECNQHPVNVDGILAQSLHKVKVK